MWAIFRSTVYVVLTILVLAVSCSPDFSQRAHVLIIVHDKI